MKLYQTTYKPANAGGIRAAIARRAEIVSESEPDKNGVVTLVFRSNGPVKIEITGQGEPFSITLGTEIA